MFSLGFLAFDCSSMEAFLASCGRVASAEMGHIPQFLECKSRLRKQAPRDTIVPIVAVHPTLEENQSMADVAPAIDDETPNRALVRARMRRLLERKIEQPPQGFRAVLMLRGVDKRSMQETAACLAITKATVRTRHFRARSLSLCRARRWREKSTQRNATGFRSMGSGATGSKSPYCSALRIQPRAQGPNAWSRCPLRVVNRHSPAPNCLSVRTELA